MKNRIGNISDKKLLKEIREGKRSSCTGELTQTEIEEIVDLLEKAGAFVELKGNKLRTNGSDLFKKYLGEYIFRKLEIGAPIL